MSRSFNYDCVNSDYLDPLLENMKLFKAIWHIALISDSTQWRNVRLIQFSF
jgi:hypothetical protein